MKILKKEDSEKKFIELSSKAKDILKSINLEIDEKIIKPEWDLNRIKFRNYLISSLDYNFLNNLDIAGLMFQSDNGLALKEYDNLNIKMLDKVFEYDFSRKNFNANGKNLSTNTIHHLYHLSKYFDYKKNIPKIKKVLEWGGGYGNMAKIFFELFDEIESYTIIDIPEFITIQKIYLTSYFGDDNVRIVKKIEDVKPGINLISINDAIKINFDSYDMFISNWALTESSLFCQEFAEKSGFFDYENLLVSYHQCGNHIPFMYESSIFDNTIKRKGIHIENIDVIPGINYYAFK